MANTPQLNIRVPLELKESFIEKAKENGTTATELIIGFMKDYLGIESDSTVQAVTPTDIDKRLADLENRFEERIAALEERISQGKQAA